MKPYTDSERYYWIIELLYRLTKNAKFNSIINLMNKGLHRKHEIHLSKKEKIVLKAQFNKDWKTPILTTMKVEVIFIIFICLFRRIFL